MERKPARDNEDGIDTNVVVGAGIARHEGFSSGGDAPQAVTVERHPGGVGGGALLDLDEGEDGAAASDQIDFPAAKLHAPGEDSPAMEPKPPSGERFGAAATLLGFPPVQAELPNWRARA